MGGTASCINGSTKGLWKATFELREMVSRIWRSRILRPDSPHYWQWSSEHTPNKSAAIRSNASLGRPDLLEVLRPSEKDDARDNTRSKLERATVCDMQAKKREGQDRMSHAPAQFAIFFVSEPRYRSILKKHRIVRPWSLPHRPSQRLQSQVEPATKNALTPSAISIVFP